MTPADIDDIGLPEDDEEEETKSVDEFGDGDSDEVLTEAKPLEVVERQEDSLEPLEEEDEEEEEEEREEMEEEEEKEPEPEPELYTVKIDGEEAKVTQDQLIAGYQKAASSDQRFQAASELEKNAKGVLSKFLEPEDAVDALTELYTEHYQGDHALAESTVDKIVGGRVEKLMELEAMSEDERKIHTLTSEKERMEAELREQSERRHEEAEKARLASGNQAAVPLLDNSIKKFDLEMGSPEDTEASEILAAYVRQGQAITQELADQVVADVTNRKRALLQNAVSGMSAEDLIGANPDLAEALRDKSIEQIKSSRATKPAGKKKSPTQRRKKKKKSLETGSSNDFFNETDW